MVNSEVIAGVDTFILYKEETTYGTAVTPDSKFGGLIQNADFDIDRQVREHAGISANSNTAGRITAQYTPGQLQIRSSIEFVVQTWDWLQYLLLGIRTGAGTSGNPYIYPLGKATRSLTLTEEIENVTTDSVRTYPGNVVNSATIKLSTGDPVSVSLELLGGKMTKGTTLNSPIANANEEVYNFSGGTIEMPDATSIGNIIESATITISNDYKLKYGMNEEAQNARAGKLSLQISLTLNYLDDDQMDRLLGSSTALTSQTPVTLALKFSKGTAGAKYADFVFTNVVLTKIKDSHNLNEFMIESAEITASQLQVTEVQS